MSKRRNLKKEKAARNQAYARQFRKKFSRSSSRNQNSGNSAKSSGGQKQTAAS